MVEKKVLEKKDVSYYIALANNKTEPLQVASLKLRTISVLQTALLISYKEIFVSAHKTGSSIVGLSQQILKQSL